MLLVMQNMKILMYVCTPDVQHNFEDSFTSFISSFVFIVTVYHNNTLLKSSMI